MRNRIIYILLFCILFIYGCATIYNPATQKNEFIFIDTAQEAALGKDFSKQVESELEISYDPDLIKRVVSIGARIAPASDRKDLEYHFKVIEDKEINAFAIPGGYIYVNTGLLEMVNDDELACVVGHEAGHVAAKHSVKALQAALGYNVFMSLLLSGTDSQNIGSMSNILFNIIHLKYSREDELLADRLGIKYAGQAGFKHEAMLTFLKKLKQKADEKGSEEGILLLRSHPYLSQRIEQAEKELELLK